MKNKKVDLLTNHKIILEMFDNLNSILEGRIDCYYTGGAMLFILNNIALKRYHADLDLFVNENQLFELKRIIDSDKRFTMISNLCKKGVNGHEYKIFYNQFPISVGIFLFERKNDNIIVTKKYYYDKPNENDLFVDERHFNSEYTRLVFNNHIFIKNGNIYKAVSQEFIYFSKLNIKESRPKDVYDINFMQQNVNIDYDLLENIKKEKSKKVDIIHIKADKSTVFYFDSFINNNFIS